MNGAIAFAVTFFGCFIAVPALFAAARTLGVYAIVGERRCYVYVLFGSPTKLTVICVVSLPEL